MTPGSSCIANAYSNNHDKIVSKEAGALKRAALNAVDALALVPCRGSSTQATRTQRMTVGASNTGQMSGIDEATRSRCDRTSPRFQQTACGGR